MHRDSKSEQYAHTEQISLDDADVVLFGLPAPPQTFEKFEGKPCLDNHQSFQYKELLSRWRTEINSALVPAKLCLSS